MSLPVSFNTWSRKKHVNLEHVLQVIYANSLFVGEAEAAEKPKAANPKPEVLTFLEQKREAESEIRTYSGA